MIGPNVNIWKSYMWTVDKEMNMEAIFTVINTAWAVVEIRLKKIQAVRIWTNDLCDTGEALYQLN